MRLTSAVKYPTNRYSSFGKTATTAVHRFFIARRKERANISGNCNRRHQRAPRHDAGHPRAMYASSGHSPRQATLGAPIGRSPANTNSVRWNCLAKLPTITAEPHVSCGTVHEMSRVLPIILRDRDAPSTPSQFPRRCRRGSWLFPILDSGSSS